MAPGWSCGLSISAAREVQLFNALWSEALQTFLQEATNADKQSLVLLCLLLDTPKPGATVTNVQEVSSHRHCLPSPTLTHGLLAEAGERHEGHVT